MSNDMWTLPKPPDTPPRLEAFVPAVLRRRFADDSSASLQAADRLHGAVLLTDLSGFCSLAERFGRLGPRGAEHLREVLNFFCGQLVDLVEAHGGEVISFAGDAALAVWPLAGGDASYVTRCAAQCAAAAQQTFAEADAPLGVTLRLRSGLGFGELWSASVGGASGRWQHLIAGDPLIQAVNAMSAVGPGELGVASPAWVHIAAHGYGRSLGDSNVCLKGLNVPVMVRPFEPAALQPAADSLLRAFVPASVQARLEARQSDWLAEFRRITALFINVGRIDYAAPDALERLHQAVVAVQTAVYRYGGSVNQVVVDDKGTVIVCGWGLALHEHGDNEVRAVRAAFEVRRGLHDAGLSGSLGIATGEAFTGLLGNSRRCSYALIGDVVNVAARLMQAANGDILCELASFEAAAARISFEALPPLTVKGRQGCVEVFRPVQVSSSGPTDVVGRVQERRRLRDRLEVLASEKRGGVVILEGDPGIGKTRLVADLIERAVTKGVRAIVTAGDAIERSAPYHVWCALFDNILDLEGLSGRGDAERRVIDLLQSNSRLVPFAPLLNPVLRLNFHETAQSQQVTPRGRALLTRELLVHLFRCAVGGRATLLVLEDAHWLDSSSWALAEGIARDLPEVLLLIAMRHLTQDEQPGELARMTRLEGTLVVTLGALGPDETRALACQRLRARAISEPVARLIYEKAEGQPFFTEELAYALRDRGLIRVEHGVCRFTDPLAMAGVQLPTTVQVVVSSRIDQLNVEEQLTIKVASIFGRTFDRAALQAAYPIPVTVDDLSAHIDALIQRDLVRFASHSPSPNYAFKHAITQEVAYSLLPYALRRQLHAAAAETYERQHPEELTPFYPLLAHHWSRAEVPERAIFYLDKAGEQALKRHANEEALRFYREAIGIDEEFAPAIVPDVSVRLGRRTVGARTARRARWHRRVGDASTNLCRWDDGRTHLLTALALIGHPIPDSPRSLVYRLGMEVLAQCLKRSGLRPFSHLSTEAADLIRDAVCAYERVGSISYQDGRMDLAAYALLAALNLAERLGPAPELALVYADVGNVLGLIPLPRLARAYQTMAIRTANRLDDEVTAARVRARAAIYRLGVGDWSVSRDIDTAMALCDQIGDSYLWEQNAAVRARAAHLTGEFELAARLGTELRRRAAASGSLPHEIWGTDIEVWAGLSLGRTDAAFDLAKAGLALLSSAPRDDRLARLDLYGALALAHFHRGELDQAVAAAAQVNELLEDSGQPGYFAVLGMSGAAEACIGVWEAHDTSGRGSEAATAARRLLRAIARYARINPPAAARAELWTGCVEWLRGRPEAAHGAWRRCLREAERFALPYEAARAHYEIGRRLQKPNPQRQVHLAKAAEGLERLKADIDVKKATVALQG